MDVDLVSAQLGRRVSDRGAIRAYVSGGYRSGMVVNPLFSERSVSRQLSDADRVPALYAYLVNDRRRLSVSPHWDAAQYAELYPDSRAARGGPLGHAWRRARQTGSMTLGAGTAGKTVEWRQVETVAEDAGRGTSFRAPDPVTPAALTAVFYLARNEDNADQVIALAEKAAASPGVTVVIVLDDPTTDDLFQAALLALRAERVHIRRGRVDSVQDVREGTVLVRGPGSHLTPAGMWALAAAGAERPTAPLWLAPDGTVASAGILYQNGQRINFLTGHPPEDAYALGHEIDVEETAGYTRAWPAGSDGRRARTLLTVSVIAPLSLPDSKPVVAPDSAFDDFLSAAGFRVQSWSESDPCTPHLVRTREFTEAESGVRLRWAIQTSAPAGPAGESWGDTHFARGIAEALRRLGQEVVVVGHDARDRPTTYLDDVTLVLRGPRRIVPPRSGIRLLWVISHPDEVTVEEVRCFDRVFAASTPWAQKAEAQWGTPISPLLQCTDPKVFTPEPGPRTGAVVFVGTARGIARPSVTEPLRAGIAVQVYGPDWTGFIPADAIVARSIPHSSLGPLYSRSAAVLNDHWPAMRREGFISNRPFDVVAAGGRVISDAVVGIEDIFGPSVREYHTVTELIEMLRGDVDTLFPSEPELIRISERIRAQHSFDARARELLDSVARPG